jgi:lipoprotein-releasing system ATP-binding protein
MSDHIVLEARQLKKSYRDGARVVEVIRDVSLVLAPGDLVGIIGQSGSGKSTLLHLLGGLDTADAGEVWLGGQRIDGLSEGAKATLRNRQLGFVYQFHHLLPEFDAIENIAMPLLLKGVSPRHARLRAQTLLAQVGLAARGGHRPGELSGGERQRVAVARALANEPACVLADEPTGNLDEATADEVFDLMASLNRQLGTAFLVVTHSLSIAGRMQKTFRLSGGSLQPAE